MDKKLSGLSCSSIHQPPLFHKLASFHQHLSVPLFTTTGLTKDISIKRTRLFFCLAQLYFNLGPSQNAEEPSFSHVAEHNGSAWYSTCCVKAYPYFSSGNFTFSRILTVSKMHFPLLYNLFFFFFSTLCKFSHSLCSL